MELLSAGVAQSNNVKLQTGRPEIDPRQRQRIFPLTSMSVPALRPTQPSVQRVTRVLSRGKVRPGRDADNLLPSSAEAKNE
jgi:hypothetical protein